MKMLAKLKCEGSIAEQLTPKYIVLSRSIFAVLINFQIQIAMFLSIFLYISLVDDAGCFSRSDPILLLDEFLGTQ
jgi:hypothetical protein